MSEPPVLRLGRVSPGLGLGRALARGFTLVEALAALVLVAIVLPVAMRGVSLALTMASETTRRTEAMVLAEAKLAELLATGAWEDGDLDGDFTETPSGDSYLTDRQDEGEGPAAIKINPANNQTG